MATIHICAMDTYGPLELHASIHRKQVFLPQSDAAVSCLLLYFGADSIQVWPADPDRLRQLGQRLIDLADSEQNAPQSEARR